jgi:hypothetical protein
MNLEKEKKKGFSEIDLNSPKINRPKNRILLPKFTPVEGVQVATSPSFFNRKSKKIMD